MATWLREEEIDLDEWADSENCADKLKPPSSMTDDVMARFHNEGQGSFGTPLPWTKAHGRWAFRPGEMTIWAGVNGHGKSLITGQVALDIAAKGSKVCMASFEMRPVQTLYRMTRQALGIEVPTQERVKAFHESTDFKIWMLDHMGTMHWRKVVGLGRFFGQAHEPFNVQHLFVDSLVKLGIAPGDYDGQAKAVNELFAMAKDTGVHVHLIHHVSKSNEMDGLDKGRVKGAGEISDQVDNICLVWRNKWKEKELAKLEPDPKARDQYDVHLDVCKQRDGEWEGKLGLYYHAHSMQFVEEVGPPIDYLARFKSEGAA